MLAGLRRANFKVKDIDISGSATGNIGQHQVKTGCKVIYVDSSVSTSLDGTSWETAFATIAEALAVASNYDTILVAHNAIMTCPTAGWTISQVGLKILGSNNHPGTQSNAIKKVAGTNAMFVITADRVEIANLCLSMRTAGPCIQIGTSAHSGGGIYQTYIHDCNIEGQSSATYGITCYDATVDAVNLVVENNVFRGFATAAIYANGTRDSYIGNTIHVATDGTGIHYVKNGADRAYGVIADNYFTGLANSTTKGIYFAGTPTAGTLILTRNYLCGTWDVTITDVGGGCMNYVVDASGGALINC